MSINLNVAPPSIEFNGLLSLNYSYSNLQQVHILQVFHCDGLLLCTINDDKRLVVWNPCLGRTWWIQHKTGSMMLSTLALGYVNNKSYHSYEILKCSSHLPESGTKFVYRSEIYEFSSGSWKVLDESVNHDYYLPDQGVSLKGNTYWCISDIEGYELLTFDFTAERFRRMCLLPFQINGHISLSVLREEKLAVLDISFGTLKIDIWVTNKFDTDDEVALHFTKSFTMDISTTGCINMLPLYFVSFVLDEEKKVALCCNSGNLDHKMGHIYILGEDDKYIRRIPYPEYTNKSLRLDEFFVIRSPLIFNYVPSLVQIQERCIFSETWRLCRPPNPLVPWHEQVWFPGAIPKHSFIMWLSCLDRLPTLSRFRNWGVVDDDVCFLCEIYVETRDHLLICCPYAIELWKWCLSKLLYPVVTFSTWNQFSLWLRSPAREASLHYLRLFAAQAIIYAIWYERNTRIFTGVRTPVEGLFPMLDRHIRNICYSRRHIPSLQDMLQVWFRGSSF